MNHFEFKQRFDELRTLQATPKAERYSLKLTDIKLGSFLKVDDVMYKVVDTYKYKYKKEKWVELKLYSLVDETTKFLEVEVDDEIELTLTEEQLKLRSLNISKADLSNIRSEDDADDISYNGKKFIYEDNYPVKFKKKDDADWQKCYLYEFEAGNKGRKEYITIEDWDGEVLVYRSIDLSPSRVEIVSI
jgi:hypothetical protein